MKFINSAQGRAWLGAYRLFVTDACYRRSLTLIEGYALTQLAEVHGSLIEQNLQPKVIELKLAHAERQVAEFSAWLESLPARCKQSIDPRTQEKLLNWDSVTKSSASSVSPVNARASLSRRIFSGILRLLKLPVTLLSRYPRLSGGLLLLSRATVIIAQAHQGQRVNPEMRDITDSFSSRKLNSFDLRSDLESSFSVNDITEAYRGRRLQEEIEPCFTGVRKQSWMLTLGGTNDDYGHGVAIGPDGDIVVTGSTQSYGMGGDGVVLAKFSAGGDLEWAQALGEPLSDRGNGIAIGPQGQVVVTGYANGYMATAKDVIMVQLSFEGNLDWVLKLGGPATDIGYSIAIGQLGEIVMVGSTESYGAGRSDVLLAQLSPEGRLEWALTLGGPLIDQGYDIVIGPLGQILVVGESRDFDGRQEHVLIAQLSAEGRLQWAQKLSGPLDDRGYGVAIGSHGQTLVVGSTYSYGAGLNDLLLAQYSSEGNFEWARTLGGPATDRGYAVAMGLLDQIVVVGYTESYGEGGIEALMAKFDAQGNLTSPAADFLLTSVAMPSYNATITVSNITHFEVESVPTISTTNITDLAVESTVFSLVHTLAYNEQFEIKFKYYIEGFKRLYSVTVAMLLRYPAGCSLIG